MATGTVRLLDAIVPEVFANYDSIETTKQARVFQSGLVTPDALMAQKLAGGGEVFQHPVWADLDDDASVIASDNPDDEIEAKKIGTLKHRFIRQFRTQAWADARLVKELIGSDPMAEIAKKTGKYWARQFDLFTIKTLTGVLADNIANDSGDMVFDATGLSGTQTIGSETVNNSQLSAKAILEARQTLGDAAEGLQILIMHSRLYTNLLRQDLITFEKSSDGSTNLPTYLGYRVIEADQMPTAVSGPDLIYTSYLCAPSIMGFAESPPDKPAEVYAEPKKGNGAGVDTLIMRKQFSMHPYGFDFTSSSVAAQFPTDAELATAGNWNRVYPERKQIKFAAIKTKNG